MPIYDQSYRRYEARGPLRRVRFWPITREALRLILVRRAFLALLAAGWLPFIGFVIFFYVVTRFPEAGNVVPVNASLFGRFFLFQWPLALLLTTFAGAGLVANDLRTGAILVYLSRPLSRRDYVIGKLGVLLALNLSVTLAPGLLLYLVGIALAPSHLLKWELATIAPAIVVYSVAIVGRAQPGRARRLGTLSQCSRGRDRLLRPDGRTRDRARRARARSWTSRRSR